MLSLVFTLDYEIHGNGEGSPLELMVEPTDRLMALLDRHGAKVTIMADVAEILRFKQHYEETGRDDFAYRPIVEQLQKAIRTGHDVQLHIHSSYMNARQRDGRWHQDWSEYNFAGLPAERMDAIVRTCKQFLESILQPVNPSYRCLAFRAANWSVSPSPNVVAALANNDILIDTSVFKFGQRQGIVRFDYSAAHHPLLPWRARPDDISQADSRGPLWEFPIYSEARGLASSLTVNRIYRALLGRKHRLADGPEQNAAPSAARRSKGLKWVMQKHAWKADFNQCSGSQLVAALKRAERLVPPGVTAPFVLIGHSKLFNWWNVPSLRPLLRHVQQHPSRFAFGLFEQFLSEKTTHSPAETDAMAVCKR
jgi:hypothetical protein